MPVKLPDTVTRRVAVVLGTSGSGQQLLNTIQPLLGKNTEIDLQGVFIEDDELQRVAALPFTKELCRLTLSVREIQSDQFERAIALQARTARRAIAGLARRMGISHTFRKVRGSTLSLLQEIIHSTDITVFEPPRVFSVPPIVPPAHTRRSQQRIVVAAGDLATLEHLTSELLPSEPVRILLLQDPGIQSLVSATRDAHADMLVLDASEELLKPESLRPLMEQLRCPICLFRQWGCR